MSTIVYTLNQEELSVAIFEWFEARHPEVFKGEYEAEVKNSNGEVSIQVEINNS